MRVKMNRRDFLQSIVGLSILSQVPDSLTGNRVASTSVDVTSTMPATYADELSAYIFVPEYQRTLAGGILLVNTSYIDLDDDNMIGTVA